MLLGIKNPWQPVSQVAQLPGHMGVFELADATGQVLYVGLAGARSRFGVRSEIAQALTQHDDAVQFRFEVTTAYMTRFAELVMAHRANEHSRPMPAHFSGQPPGSIRFGTLTPGASQ